MGDQISPDDQIGQFTSKKIGLSCVMSHHQSPHRYTLSFGPLCRYRIGFCLVRNGCFWGWLMLKYEVKKLEFALREMGGRRLCRLSSFGHYFVLCVHFPCFYNVTRLTIHCVFEAVSTSKADRSLQVHQEDSK